MRSKRPRTETIRIQPLRLRAGWLILTVIQPLKGTTMHMPAAMQTITITLNETPSGARRLAVKQTDFHATRRHFRHRDYGVDLREQADTIADEMATLMGVRILGVIQPHTKTSDKWERTYALTLVPYSASLPLTK